MSTTTTPLGIQETVQVLAAFYAVSDRYINSMEDGNMSRYEALKFFFDLGPINKAVENIHLVPAELQDLSDAEMERLAAEIAVLLKEWKVKHRVQDITGIVARRLLTLIRILQALIAETKLMFAEIKALPPSAEPVEG